MAQNIYGGDIESNVDPVTAEQMKFQSDDAFNVVHDQWSAYTRARDAGHLDWVEEARKFDDFYYGDQWEDDVKATLDAQKRPYHTINLVLSTVNAVVGEYIHSRQDISFVPIGKGASAETATALRFLFKQIALNNKSEQKEKTVFMDGLIQDRGYFYYYLDFSDNMEGELREEVLDPTDVILDPGAKDYDPETWAEVFISRWMTPEEIGALYGPEYKNIVDLAAANGTFGHDSLEWEAPNFSGNHYNSEVFFESSDADVRRVKRIRVIERQYRRLTRTAFFVDKETADMRRVPEGWDAERVTEFATKLDLALIWKPERRIRRTITADRILLHDDWSLFDKFSIVPYFPYFRRGRPFGLVRNLISPQEMLNKVTSQELHVVNTTANSGWVFKTGSLINMDRDDLVTQGAKTGLVIEYDGDSAPEKIQPNQIPSGLDQISNKAGIFFREISGVNEAMLGQTRSDSSKALDARRRGGLVQQEIIFDNLDHTRKLRAEFMLQCVQRYYNETRLLQIFEKNEDGDDVQMELAVNQPMEYVDPESQKVVEEILNDLTVGEYSVAITNVPRRDTYDESVFDQVMQMREAGVAIPDYVMIENSQLPDKKELAEISKKIAGLAAPTEEEVARAQMLDDMQMRLLNAQVMNEEAQAQERLARAQNLMATGQAAMVKAETDQVKIGAEHRATMEGIESKERMNTNDLLARIELMRMKNTSSEQVSQVQSMTTRTKSALDRRATLEAKLLELAKAEKQKSSQSTPKKG